MKLQLSSSLLLSALILAGCADDESFDMVKVREIRATLNGFKSEEEAVTRTTHTISEVSGFQTLWAKGDVLGIFPIGGDQVTFPISDGVGTTTAKFDGGSWALRGTYKYAAYYPFNPECYMIDQTQIPVSFAGQVQTGNNSMSHLGAFDFMAAAGTQPSANGSVNLQFNHVGCFLRMQLTMPEAADFTEATVSVEGGSFAVKGDVDLSASTPSLHPTTKLNKLMLSLKNVHTTAANQTITLYMMVAPDDMMGKTLTFAVKDSKGKVYAKTAAGKRMMANYAYNYSFAFTSSDILGIDGTTGGGGWATSPDPNGHEYVDLGLPSGTLWATCNVGSISATSNGYYFAWGERKPKGNIYRWTNYKHRRSVVLDYQGHTQSATITKYCTGNYPGDIDYKTTLEHQDDAAAVNWGGDWRMPTAKEYEELLNECTWTAQDSHRYFKVTSKSNGKSIYFPSGGGFIQEGQWFREPNEQIYYWTSSLSLEHDNKALAIWGNIYSPGLSHLYEAHRSHGRQIRPVMSAQVYRTPHEYVDLGVKDNNGNPIYWATCNIGATSPEDKGLLFAWGETTGYNTDEKKFNDWSNYLFNVDNSYNFNAMAEYCTDNRYGTCDNRSSLSLEDDAAHILWGGNWRMPTDNEIKALCEQCWGHYDYEYGGFVIVGPNGNSIIIPGEYLWSSSLDRNDNEFALCLSLNCGKFYEAQIVAKERYRGLYIRPVCQ